MRNVSLQWAGRRVTNRPGIVVRDPSVVDDASGINCAGVDSLVAASTSVNVQPVSVSEVAGAKRLGRSARIRARPDCGGSVSRRMAGSAALTEVGTVEYPAHPRTAARPRRRSVLVAAGMGRLHNQRTVISRSFSRVLRGRILALRRFLRVAAAFFTFLEFSRPAFSRFLRWNYIEEAIESGEQIPFGRSCPNRAQYTGTGFGDCGALGNVLGQTLTSMGDAKPQGTQSPSPPRPADGRAGGALRHGGERSLL